MVVPAYRTLGLGEGTMKFIVLETAIQRHKIY